MTPNGPRSGNAHREIIAECGSSSGEGKRRECSISCGLTSYIGCGWT